MWILIWVVLIVAAIVTPIVMIYKIITKAIGAFKQLGDSAEMIGQTTSKQADLHLRDVPATSGVSQDQATIDKAVDMRHYVMQSRAFRRRRRLRWAMLRWQRALLTHTDLEDLPFDRMEAPQPPQQLGAVAAARMTNGTP